MFLKFIFTDQKVGGILLCTSVAFSFRNSLTLFLLPLLVFNTTT